MEQRENRPTTADEAAICARQEALLSRLREAIAAAEKSAPRRNSAGNSGLAALRDAYSESGEEDRPAVLAQMSEEAARQEALAPRHIPGLEAPYFGYMRLRSRGRSRDVLLGDRGLIDSRHEVTLVDWRKAPIAEVFFTCEPGDDYEIEVDGRAIEGVLEESRIVSFDRGELSEISTEGGSFQRRGGNWCFAPGGLVPSLRTINKRAKERTTGRVAELLDAHQTALLERDPSQPLLVLGSAGCGKTTVALHRVAMLCQRYKERFDPSRMLVVVPEPGLLHFAQRLLEDLGVEGVLLRTFDEWIRDQARSVFPWLPERESPDPPFAVSKIKRHPAMFAAIDRLIDELTREIGERLDARINGKGAVAEAFAARKEPFLADRLRLAEKEVAKSLSPEKKRALAEDLREERKKLKRVRKDHQRLVGDRALLDLAVRASSGELPKGIIEEVAWHTGMQMEEPSEVRFAHVDADRLQTLDGRSLDEGTPDAVAGTVDVEDYALLFELLWRKTGKTGASQRGELSRYTHIVIDEAQELSPIELRLLGRAVDPERGSVTVAGDAAQRIDRTGYFSSWEGVMASLGTSAEPAYLETSYRCPKPIVEFSHAILGAEAPGAMPRADRDGAPVVRTRLPSEGHAAVAIASALKDLLRHEPDAQVAVVAYDEKSARAFHEVLSRALPARLVLDGNFSFAPGVEVTEVAQVKGLEFDVVVLPDADARRYTDTPEHRRMLYVAVTRASERLWVVSPGKPSPILPPT